MSALADTALTHTVVEPRSLSELLALSPDELSHVDIGWANLLCAEGLPGAEELDLEEYLQRLDAWAERVRERTEQSLHVFYASRKQYDYSEALFRVVALARFLSSECRIRYNPTQVDPANWDFSDSRDQLLHGLLGPTRTGTCSSLPLLLTALGRRLGYPLRIAFAPGHVFCRWEGESHTDRAWRERFNIEYNGLGVDKRTDKSYYNWPRKWPAELIEAESRRTVKQYLRSLDPLEELAMALNQRGQTLEAVGRLEEAWDTFVSAHKYAPHNENYVTWCKLVHEKKLEQALKPLGITQERFFRLVELRLQGSSVLFPWEDLVQRPWFMPSHAPHPMHDAVGAAAYALAIRIFRSEAVAKMRIVAANHMLLAANHMPLDKRIPK